MDDDPIHDEQLAKVEELLGRWLSASEYEGFLIVGNRFVDRFGGTRIGELSKTFETHRPVGRAALAASLSRVAHSLGSYERFATAYPVTIIPPLPAYPLFPIVGIENIRPEVYRILDSTRAAAEYVKSTRRLPLCPYPAEPVLRKRPQVHWCAYERWETPDETRRRLQILPGWSDCQLRATLSTASVAETCFVAYSNDPNDPGTKGLEFHGYFFEGLTQDHDELGYAGDAVQIWVFGEPQVTALEEWDTDKQIWSPL